MKTYRWHIVRFWKSRSAIMCEQPFTRADLDNLIKELLDITEIPFLIKKQIREYIAERGFTYKGIARALCFAIEQRNVKIRDTYKQYGIGIIKTVYQDAHNFYERLKQQQIEQERRQQEIINTMAATTNRVIYCGTGDTKKRIKKKQIDISQL